jgi:lysophospholipase L1-like esterase
MIVIQFTSIFRDVIILDGVKYPLQNMAPTFDEYVELFIKKNMTLEQFCERAAEQVLDKFKVILQKIEVANPTIKIRVISWENDIDSVMRNDEYYKDKVVDFQYKDKTFKNLREIIYSYSKLTIAESFTRRCIDDQHMNIEGHKLIAESIYKTI